MTDRIDQEHTKTPFMEQVREFFQWMLALKVTDEERLLVTDPGNIYLDDISNRRPMVVAAVLALLVHLILLIISLPQFSQDLVIADQAVLKLKRLARPSGGGPPKVQQVQPQVEQRVAPRPTPAPLPIPDPTPLEPDPIVRENTLQVNRVVDEIAMDLNIGDITGPPSGRGQGTTGDGSGPSTGAGASDGLNGPFRFGQAGVTPPEVLKKPTPAYTDEAIKAKIQGSVMLQAIVYEDGSVGGFKVLRPLGYGLEERAIESISNEWVFRPGTHNGKPVPVVVVIEVTFTLR